MRHLAIGFALILVGFPHGARAGGPPATQSATARIGITGSGLRALLATFDIGLISKAHAAECKEEGEICKSNADCCSGLECSGGPQTTCRPEE